MTWNPNGNCIGAGLVDVNGNPISSSNPLFTSDANANNPIPAGTNSIGSVDINGDYPKGASPLHGSTLGVSGTLSVTFAAAAGLTNYLLGWKITCSTAAAAVLINIQITGLKTSNPQFFTAGGPLTPSEIGQLYGKGVPCSAVNTALIIAILTGANVGNYTVEMWGYQL